MTDPRTILLTSYASPCGRLLLGALDGRLCLCDWQEARDRRVVLRRLARHLQAGYAEASCDTTLRAARQLDEYFAGRRRDFDLPLLLAGTDFQCAVWQALRAVPYGRTASYAVLARRIGRPRSVRAAAAAVGANALSVFMPCHRIVGTGGALTGYAGGLEAKRFLLALEAGAGGE